MLYRIVDYNPRTKIAYGIQTSYLNMQNLNGYVVPLLANKYVVVGKDYSFIPKSYFLNNTYIRGELDVSRR